MRLARLDQPPALRVQPASGGSPLFPGYPRAEPAWSAAYPATPSWSAARPGRIVEAMAHAEVASPVIVLDEIEKVSTGRYDPAPVLLDLLDRSSGQRWHDEYFGIDFDVSSALFVATCNDLGLMDPALRSRFREIRVAAPAKDALPGIIASAWGAHRRLYPGLRLPATLPAPAIRGP